MSIEAFTGANCFDRLVELLGLSDDWYDEDSRAPSVETFLCAFELLIEEPL